MLLENEELPADSGHGWQSWQDSKAVLLRINVMRKLQPGLSHIIVRYEAPFTF